MEAGLPDVQTDIGREGQLMHRYAVDPALDRSFLSPNQRDILARGDSLLDEVLARINLGETHEIRIERPLVSGPLGLKGNKDGPLTDRRLPGRPDKIHLWPEAMLISDWKFGYAEVERAEMNLQLRSYAVIGSDNYGSKPNVFVSIIQPRARYDERISLARYEPADIEQARIQIANILIATEPPDAPLVAGEEQCQYCRAKLICPAFRQAITSGIVPFEPGKELTKTALDSWVEDRLASCDDAALEAVYKAVRFGTYIKNSVLDEIRKRIRAGGFTDYILGKTPEPRKIINVRRAVALLVLSKVASREELLDLCELPVGDIEEMYRRRTKATWKETRDRINKLLESVIEIEERHPKIIKK